MKRRPAILYITLGTAIMLLLTASLIYGSVKIPLRDVLGILSGNFDGRESWRHIVLESRLPQCVTALLGGAALASAGLMLQTLFRNPLAGPSILGISDGANLGVAIVMLYFSVGNYFTTVLAAFVGAAAVLMIILAFSRKVQNTVMLLIIGIMTGYVASSAISILNFQASADKVHQYVLWGMGDFTQVSLDKLPWFAGFTLAGILGAVLMTKPLNALLLGDNYAANLGVNVRRTRLLILIVTGLLTASVTAFCGPISFIGLAVPHVARLALGSSDHRHLLPMTLLWGGSTALLCNLLTLLPAAAGVLPLNAVTSILGAPVIVYVILNRNNIHYFN